MNATKISRALLATQGGPSHGAGTIWSQFRTVGGFAGEGRLAVAVGRWQVTCNTWHMTPDFSSSFISIFFFYIFGFGATIPKCWELRCPSYAGYFSFSNFFFKGSVVEYILHFICHRINYNEGVTECTNLLILCDTCIQWISIIIYLKLPALECLISGNWSWSIFLVLNYILCDCWVHIFLFCLCHHWIWKRPRSRLYTCLFSCVDRISRMEIWHKKIWKETPRLRLKWL